MSTVDIIVPAYGEGMSGTFQKSLSETISRNQCRCGNHETWECDRGKHSIFVQPHVDSCVIHWSRNSLVSQFLHALTVQNRPPAEYCLMLDDDILLEVGTLERMISHKKDILVGICTKRSDPPMPTIRKWDEEGGKYVEIVEWKWDSQKLIEVDAAGAACMLVKRKVLEDLRDAYLRCTFEREQVREALVRWNAPLDSISEFEKDIAKKSEVRQKRYQEAIEAGDWQKASCWWFEFLKDHTGNERGELGEDLSFCKKVKQLGFRIWADPQVLPGHLGDYAYSCRDYQFFRESQKMSVLPRGEEHDVPAIGSVN